MIDDRNDVSYEEYFPPVLFFAAENPEETEFTFADNGLTGEYSTTLEAGESRVINFVVGYTLEDSEDQRAAIRQALMTNGPVSEAWSKRVDHFTEEDSPELRRELIWHNYVLEVMANYSEYFEETFISQGTMYLYDWGLHAAPRDENQHALAI